MVFEPKFGISPSRISSYNVVHGGNNHYSDMSAALKAWNGSNKHSGNVSKKAAKRIRSKIEWLCYLAKKRRVQPQSGGKSFDFKINFLTLTLPSPQKHTDNEIKAKCLNQFLTELRQKFGMKNYVWKAELQGNQNIHFHITTDTYIHHETIRNIWNRNISKLGYVQSYQDKMRIMSFGDYVNHRSRQGSANVSKLRKGYEYGQKTDWCSPNSTDVKTVKNVQNLANYLAKYLTKDIAKKSSCSATIERLAAFTGNLWYCSTSLSRLSTYKTHPSGKAIEFTSAVANLKKSLICVYDYCECIYFSINEIPPKLARMLRAMLLHHALATGYQIQNG